MSTFHSYARQRGLALNHFDCSGQILDRLWIVSGQFGAVEAFLFHAGISIEPPTGRNGAFPAGPAQRLSVRCFQRALFSDRSRQPDDSLRQIARGERDQPRHHSRNDATADDGVHGRFGEGR